MSTRFLFRSFLILPFFSFVLAGPTNPQEKKAPAEFQQGVVVSVSAPASDVGLAILKKGGSAVDAAVATAFALAVTYPPAGNIGGGGFMLVHPPGGKDEPILVDYRETAPGRASRTMFTKSSGPNGHRVVGTPGTVRGLAMAHKRFGKLPWAELVRPAVVLAQEGFVLDDRLAESLNRILAESADFAELQRVFAKPDKTRWKAGDRLVQPDLARTMKLLADNGPDEFYTGTVGRLLVEEMVQGQGYISAEDLAKYQAIARQPLHTRYRDTFDVYAPPPPSAGGTCLFEMLHQLETFDLKKTGRFTPETMHVMTEAMRRAYCDRARFLGDPGFTKIPAHLTTRDHARKLAASIDLTRATRSEELGKDFPLVPEGDSTTHFSVIDKDGLAVANTYTLERSYGCRVVVKGAGFLLNNEMLDFNWFPGHTDRLGRIGTEANTILPGKKMLSSQTPTIVTKNGKVFLVTGSPGGRTITNTVLCVLVNVLDFDMPIQEAVDAPRQHHQWFPDELQVERLDPATQKKLKEMGHALSATKTQGDAHSIWVNPATGRYVGAADRRINGKVSGY